MEDGRDGSPGRSAQVTDGVWDTPPPGVMEYLIRDHCIVSTLRLINSDRCKGVDGVNRVALSKSLSSADIENWVVALLKKFPRVDTIECGGRGILKTLAAHFPGKVVLLKTYVREPYEWKMLPKFGNIETLRLNAGCSDNDLAHLSTMTTLKELECQFFGSFLENVDALSCLTNLQTLVFDRCKINTLQFVEPLTGLVELRSTYNYVEGCDYGAVSALTNLTSLDLCYTTFGDGDASCLSSLVNLENLDLDETNIGDSGFCHVSHFTKLSHLSIYGSKLTETGSAPIAHLGDLEYLCVGHEAMTFENGAFLVQLIRLRELHMSGIVQNDVMQSIAALTCLTDLRVNVSIVTNDAFSLLGNLSHLETLCLDNSGNPYVARESLDWGCIPQVRHLQLCQYGWLDGSLVNLSRMEKLQNLIIHSDSITDDGVQHVTKVEKLEHLVCACRRLSKKCQKKLKERFQRFETWAI